MTQKRQPQRKVGEQNSAVANQQSDNQAVQINPERALNVLQQGLEAANKAGTFTLIDSSNIFNCLKFLDEYLKKVNGTDNQRAISK